MTVPVHLIKVHGPFESSASFAHILGWLADFIESDEPTSYTNHQVHDGLARLLEAGGAKLQAADAISDGSPKAKGRRVKL